MATNDPTSLILNEKDLHRVRHFIDVQEYICLLNIFSSRGFGKSTFLEMVKDSYRSNFPLSLVYALDYYPEDKEGSYRLDDLLSQLLSDLRNFGSDKEKQALNTSVELKTVYDLAARIIEWIDLFSRNGKTTLIIIDDYDRLPHGSRVIFEDILLSKAIDEPRKTKVILTSGRELSFTDRLDLRVRLTTHALSTLDEQDIARTISTKTDLAPTILRWSGGIPDLAEFLINRAKKKNIERREVNHLHERELIDQDYRSHISKVMFPDVELLTDKVVDVLSLLRRFDVSILSTVLPKIEPKRFSSFKQKDYFDLIRELGDRVYWRDQGGYALNNVLQVMLSSYIRAFEPSLFEKVNDIVAKTYRDWLKEEFRIHYLTEMLYHEVQIRKLRDEDDDNIVQYVSSAILRFIEDRGRAAPNQIDGLDEIQHVLSEDVKLRPYVKPEIFETIEKTLRQ